MDLRDRDPLLFPTPRRCERRGGGGPVGRIRAADPDPVLPAGGCRLDLGRDGAALAWADAAGERRARALLAQLGRQYGAIAPCVRIEDAPAFPTRGVMLDISRDRMPTVAELERVTADLAGFGINHLELYSEHAIAYPGHEEAWGAADPLTADDLRRLDRHAAGHGVRLSANQNCFGHLDRWLAKPRYRPLAEIQDGDRWRFADLDWRTTPHSLCPTDPRSLELVREWLAHLTAWLPSPLVNIGCDETYDVGFGRSRAVVEAQGRAAVYAGFVAAVCAEVRRLGRRPAFWADIALDHPEALERLPADLLALCWGYEPDAPFARWLAQVRGREAWVCPGTACWLTTGGRTAERRGNLHAAAVQGLAGGATGFLVTVWGDQGHRQPWPVSWWGLAEGAHRAWAGAAPFDPLAASLHAFGDLRTGPWFDALGDVDEPLRAVGGKVQPDGHRARLRNRSALYHDLHLPWAEPWVGDRAAWAAVRAAIDALGPAPAGDEGTWALDYTRFAADRALARRGAAAADLGPRLADLRDRHGMLWLQRARRGGLADSRMWWERIAAAAG
ncbi:MAG: hypothetical protein RLZZ127_125 [Planctomycetota bacterium]|jgi:hypothetical protein